VYVYKYSKETTLVNKQMNARTYEWTNIDLHVRKVKGKMSQTTGEALQYG